MLARNGSTFKAYLLVLKESLFEIHSCLPCSTIMFSERPGQNIQVQLSCLLKLLCHASHPKCICFVCTVCASAVVFGHTH